VAVKTPDGMAPTPGNSPAESSEGTGKGKNDPKNPPGKVPLVADLEPKFSEVPKTGTRDWKPSTLSASALADRVGTALKSLRNTSATTVATIKTSVPGEQSAGGIGRVTSAVKVRDDKVYSIEFPVIAVMPETGVMKADGSKRGFSGPNGGGISSKTPIATPAPEASWNQAALLKNWPTAFPKLAFMGLTDGKDPWAPVIRGLHSGNDGFKTTVSERVIRFRGKDVRNYRIVAERTPAAAKALGPCQIEMVFDGARYLPVTIRVNALQPKKAEFHILWQASWNFRQTFQPKDFAF
jgi:hypothetical protein